MPNKHRRGGVKQQHSIIPGIRKRLQKIAACPYVQAVTPGRIFSATGSQEPVVVFQYFQATGMKLIGKIPGAVQEIFVVSSQREAALNWLTAANLVLLEENRPGKPYSQKRKGRTTAGENSTEPISEASPDTLRRYMQLSDDSDSPLMVAVGDRLNGKMHDFRTKLLQEAEVQKKRERKRKSKRRRQPPNQQQPISQPTTMEQWLKAAEKQGTEYWRKIKADKES
ncbi:MAG: hypothetical protein GX047_08485 [Firmicutes bacterium]|jgi:hypothetical protein|nr:hypothetical protein [Bacillota bacterium]